MIRELPLALISTDAGTQMRVKTKPAVVKDYAEHFDNSEVPLPPVVVFYDGTTYYLADGFHRIEAALSLKYVEIDAEVREGGQRDALLYACSANADHGLRRTTEDKRRAVATLLRDAEWSKWSDRKVAEMCKVTHPFVATMRKRISEVETLPPETGGTAKRRHTRITARKWRVTYCDHTAKGMVQTLLCDSAKLRVSKADMIVALEDAIAALTPEVTRRRPLQTAVAAAALVGGSA